MAGRGALGRLHKPNVYIDLSGWSPKYFPPQLVQYANTLLKEKVLFGTDYPALTPERWLRDFDTLEIKRRGEAADPQGERGAAAGARRLARVVSPRAPTSRAARGTRCSGGSAARLVRDKPQAREAARELLERELRLELAQRRPDAEVDPLAEGQVALGVRRAGSKRSGSAKTAGSRPAAASHRNSLAPSGSSTPPSVTGRFVTRRQTGTDVSKRSVSSTTPPMSAGVGDDRVPALGRLEQAADACCR